MKIVSEEQLSYIKAEYRDLIDERLSNYVFEGSDRVIFENLILFTDDNIYEKIRADHYLAMTKCQKIWNKYFWCLRYNSDVSKNGGSAKYYHQKVFEIAEELFQVCDNANNTEIALFVEFAEKFEEQEYIIFDYFHPAFTDAGVSLKSTEFQEIIELLGIQNLNFDDIDKLIENNIDNTSGELITYKSGIDCETMVRIDTYSASEDQINPIDILIKCQFKYKEQVDKLLVKWWTTFWRKMGPFVAISILDKFENEKHFIDRKRITKSY